MAFNCHGCGPLHDERCAATSGGTQYLSSDRRVSAGGGAPSSPELTLGSSALSKDTILPSLHFPCLPAQLHLLVLCLTDLTD